MGNYKRILFLFLLALPLTSLSGQTYHYSLQAIVTNGQKSSASGDGHYLTFTSQGVYESDTQGYSTGTGSFRYAGNDQNGHRCYEGDGYLGNNLVYRFSSDLQRINVVLPDRRIAVYVKSSTSGGERSYSKSSSEQAASYSSYSSSSSSSHVNSYSSQKKEVVVDCPGCGGRGYIQAPAPRASTFGVKQPVYVTCPKCGSTYDKYEGHACIKCKVCDGTGKITKKL